jgi:hypothetical protein
MSTTVTIPVHEVRVYEEGKYFTTLDQAIWDATEDAEERLCVHLHVSNITPFFLGDQTYLIVTFDEFPTCDKCSHVHHEMLQFSPPARCVHVLHPPEPVPFPKIEADMIEGDADPGITHQRWLVPLDADPA